MRSSFIFNDVVATIESYQKKKKKQYRPVLVSLRKLEETNLFARWILSHQKINNQHLKKNSLNFPFILMPIAWMQMSLEEFLLISNSDKERSLENV